MFLDKQYRPLSCHDTWISIDPIVGCPFSCAYCVLRHSNGTGTRPKIMMTPQECVQALLRYHLFVPGVSRLAIGNETDIAHSSNVDYLVRLLEVIAEAEIENSIALVTKAPLSAATLRRIRAAGKLNVVFFLSYSGLGQRFEPNFTDAMLRNNFEVVHDEGFRIVHYWRPLLPENTTTASVEKMLSFVSRVADASIAVGLKLHPHLTRLLSREGVVNVPAALSNEVGEWLDTDIVDRILEMARTLCPDYPLYRHTSCGLAKVMRVPNHTGTIYRHDICAPSSCPSAQRAVCEAAKRVPEPPEIVRVLERIGRPLSFVRNGAGVQLLDRVTQEEYSYVVQNLSCPVRAQNVEMQNLYYGSIHEGGWQPRQVATEAVAQEAGQSSMK